MPTVLSFQPQLRRRLPGVLGNADYTEIRETLQRMSDSLAAGNINAAHVLSKTPRTFS